MDSLELSKEQRSHLLEMCRILFPEYNEIIFGMKNYPHTDYVWMYDQSGCFFEIHWFELCCTHLFMKILVLPNGYESIEDYISMNSRFISGHPVDYLYEKFKELQ